MKANPKAIYHECPREILSPNGGASGGKSTPSTALKVVGTVTTSIFAGSFSCSSNGLTNLTVSQLTIHSVPAAQFSTNVALPNALNPLLQT